MFLEIFGSPWALIAVWIVGPAILFALHRRNERRAAAASSPAGPGAPASPAVPKRSDTAVTKVPAQPLDVTSGFRGIRWGDPPPAAFARVEGSGDEETYERPGEPRRVEDVPVETIRYVFTGGHLSAVKIDASLHLADRLLKALTERWGDPEPSDARARKHQWARLAGGAKATAAWLERNPVAQRATLWILHKSPTHPA